MRPQPSRTRRGGRAPARDAAATRPSLHARAERAARRMAELERAAFHAAREECLALTAIWRKATRRLEALDAGAPERFRGEGALAEMALCDVARWELPASAAYTILAFANLRDRLLFITGSGTQREALVCEALRRGGVCTARGQFMEILR